MACRGDLLTGEIKGSPDFSPSEPAALRKDSRRFGPRKPMKAWQALNLIPCEQTQVASVVDHKHQSAHGVF